MILRVAIVWICLLANISFGDGLSDYIKGAPTFSNLKILTSERVQSVTITQIEFQSQLWQQSAWRHSLVVFRPASTAFQDKALMIIAGTPPGDERVLGLEAARSGVTAAVLYQVPNQPLFGDKKEDKLLAFTLSQYKKTGDQSWPLLFPMVTSVVRALDLLQSEFGLREFVLTGASKRGWSAYLTAAVDERVRAIAPVVFEMVNIPAQIALARNRYGRDSEKLRAYTELKLTDSLDDPRIEKLKNWIDPVSYQRVREIPKLITLGSNDPYWVIDSLSLYADKFVGPKIIRMLPNVGHGAMGVSSARQGVVEFTQEIFSGRSLPTFKIDLNQDNLTLTSDHQIEQVRLWVADSDSPDFRAMPFREAGWIQLYAKTGVIRWGRGSAKWRAGFIEAKLSGLKNTVTSQAIVRGE